MKSIEAIIFDWAGTTVDYGCMAPVVAMQNAFEKYNINVTYDEIRKPMGLAKLDHIKIIIDNLGLPANKQLIENIYKEFEENIFATLTAHTTLIPGLLEVLDYLENNNIKVGTTTGYTAAMMKVVANEAKKQGYTPQSIVTPDEVTCGRPYPYMIQKNMMTLAIKDVRKIIKVGDTIADLQEGLHAGCYSIGVVKGSSMLGFDEKQVKQINKEDLTLRCESVRKEMLSAGAHSVIESIVELPQLIERLS